MAVREAGVLRLSVEDYEEGCRTGVIPKALQLLSSEQPFTTEDLLKVLYTLGWLAPADEFIPATCEFTIEYEEYFFIAAGQQYSKEFCGPTEGILKMKDLRVTPVNATAIASGRLEQRFGKLKSFGDPCAPYADPAKVGQFSTLSNITIRSKGVFVTTLINGDPNSQAIFLVTARQWFTR